MLNYQGAIQATAMAKEECYHLATDAFNASQPDTQIILYNIADKIQEQIERLMEAEVKNEKMYRQQKP